MKPDRPQNERDQLEAKLSALLLGELTADEAESVRHSMAQDPELARLYGRLKLTIDLLREGAARPAEQTTPAPAPLKLSDERRQKLLAQFKTIAPKEFAEEKHRSPRWIIPVSAAAAIALFALLPMLITQQSGPTFTKLGRNEAAAPSIAKPDAVQDEMAKERAIRLPQAKEELRSPVPIDGGREGLFSPIPQVQTKELPATAPTATPAPATAAGPIAQPKSRIVEIEDAWNPPPAKAGTPNKTPNELARATAPSGASPLNLGADRRSDGSDANAAGVNLNFRLNSAPGSAPVTDKEKAGLTAGVVESKRERDLAEGTVPAQNGGIGAVGGRRGAGRSGGGGGAGGFGGGGGAGGGFSGSGGPGGRGGSYFVDGPQGTVAAPAATQPPPPAISPAIKYGTYAFNEQPASGQNVPQSSPASKPWNMTLPLRGFYDDSPQNSENEKLAAVNRSDSSALNKPLSLTPPPSTLGPLANSSGTGFSSDRADLADSRRADHDHTFNLSIDHSFSERYLQTQLPATPGLTANLYGVYSNSSTYQANNDFFRMQSAAEPALQAGQQALLGDTPALGYLFSENTVVPASGQTLNADQITTLSGRSATQVDLSGGEPYSVNVVGYVNVDSARMTNKALTANSLLTSDLRAETQSNAGTLETGKGLALNRGETVKQFEGVDAKDNLARRMPTVTVNSITNAGNMSTRSTAGQPNPFQGRSAYIQQAQTAGGSKKPGIGDTAAVAVTTDESSSAVVVQSSPETVAAVKAVVAGLGRESKTAQSDPTPPKPAAEAPIPQPEIQTTDNAFSTFSLNISDVSFRLAAAALEKGVMPEAASVRSEEFINAFDYRDPEAPAGVPIAFASERAHYPFAHNRDLLRLSLKTAAAGRQNGRAINLVLLLDNSGSMERADRVRILHEALRVLATQLQPQDKLSVITFARTARLWVDGLSGAQAGEVADGLSGLTPEGGTNLEEAMNLAYATAARHYLATGINRVVLLTDGAANLGNVDPSALKRTVEAYRKQGIALDCFGIGWEGYNDDLLEQLARNGDGRYAFLNTPEEAASDFAGKLAGALQVAASDVKVQVEFNPRRVTAYRQIGYAKHQLTKEQFRDNTVDAAEIAAAEAGNALYAVEVNPAGQGPLCTVRVRFKVPGTADYREQEWPVAYTGSVPALEQSSPAMRLAAAASAFSEWLVASPFAGEVAPDRLLSLLNGVPETYGADARPQKLVWMIREAKALTGN